MGLEHFCLERSHWVFLPRSCPLGSALCALCGVCHPLCGLTKYMVFDTALSPTSTMGMQVIGLGVLQALCSQSHQCRFISADLLKLGIGTTTVVHLYLPWELWNQSSPQLCLCMCPPTKTAAAITGLTPVTGAPVIHLDVQQALSSQNCHWWHKSVDHTAAGTWLRFQPFFLSHAAPGD